MRRGKRERERQLDGRWRNVIHRRNGKAKAGRKRQERESKKKKCKDVAHSENREWLRSIQKPPLGVKTRYSLKCSNQREREREDLRGRQLVVSCVYVCVYTSERIGENERASEKERRVKV